MEGDFLRPCKTAPPLSPCRTPLCHFGYVTGNNDEKYHCSPCSHTPPSLLSAVFSHPSALSSSISFFIPLSPYITPSPLSNTATDFVMYISPLSLHPFPSSDLYIPR